MRRQLSRSRLWVSLGAMVIVMWDVRADAQTALLASEESSYSGSRDTTVTINGNAKDFVRPDMPSRSLFAATQSVGQAQSAAQTPKRRDSVLNGVLIGAGIGALLGLIPDYYDDCEECHDSLYASIAVGAGIGLVVDLLRSNTRPSLRSPSDDRFRMSIAGGRRAVGVSGVVRWR